ncbi:MAG: transcriptional repressor, partial [Pseudolabrys sp.]
MTLTRTSVVPHLKSDAEHSPDRSALTGCPWHDVKAMLRQVGLRPTRQRMALGWILFGKGDRHLTAEMLYEEATRAKVPVSLATIYN